MKFAVLSDIHGNKDALSAVLEDISQKKITNIYNLGDSLYGPLFPLETYNLIKNAGIRSVKGNCDRLLEDRFSNNPTVQYGIQQLEAEQLEWLKSLPFSIATEDFYFCHATPKDDAKLLIYQLLDSDVILKNTNEIMSELEEVSQNIIFCGHSHLPMILYLPNNKIIANPGSVGLPAYEEEEPFYYKMESGNPFAKYMIVEKRANRWVFEQVSIPYNTTASILQSNINNRRDWAVAIERGYM